MPRLSILTVLLTLSSCTLGNALDVCERAPATERDLNGRTEGDQRLGSRNVSGPMPGGGAMVVWTSTLNGVSEARGALVSADGTLVPTCEQSAEFTFSARGHDADQVVLAPPRTTDQLGVIIYRRRQGGLHSLWAVPITPSGCPIEPLVGPVALQLYAGGAGQQVLNPSVVSLGDSAYVVTWTEIEPSRLRTRLFAQHFRLPGIGRAVQLLGPVADAVERNGNHANGTLIPLLDGAALAYFELDVAAYRVWLVRLAPDLSQRFPPVLVSQNKIPSALVPEDVSIALAFDTEIFLVTWMAGDENLKPVIQARFLDGTGHYLTSPRAPSGEVFRLGSVTGAAEAEVSVIGTGEGGFLAAWQESGTLEHADRSGRGLRAVAFQPNGAVRFSNRACAETDFQLNLAMEEDQLLPSLTRLVDGTLFATWVTVGGDTTDRSGAGLRSVGLTQHDLFPIP